MLITLLLTKEQFNSYAGCVKASQQNLKCGSQGKKKGKFSIFKISLKNSAAGFSNTWKPIMTGSIVLKSITERRSGRQTCCFFYSAVITTTCLCGIQSHHGAQTALRGSMLPQRNEKNSLSPQLTRVTVFLLTWVKLILPECQIWKWWRGSVWVEICKKKKKKSQRNCTDMRLRRKKEGVIFRCLLDCCNMTQQTTTIHKRTVFYPLNSR